MRNEFSNYKAHVQTLAMKPLETKIWNMSCNCLKEKAETDEVAKGTRLWCCSGASSSDDRNIHHDREKLLECQIRHGSRYNIIRYNTIKYNKIQYNKI